MSPEHLDAAELVLLDSSGIYTCCSVGAQDQLLAFLGGRARVTVTVYEELHRRSGELHTLSRLLESGGLGEPFVPSIAELDNVTRILGLPTPGVHVRQDRGEVETVVVAQGLKSSRRVVCLLMDDGFGQRLANARQLNHVNTPTLALWMVCAKALDRNHGFRVWQAAIGRQVKRADFNHRLAELCPSL